MELQRLAVYLDTVSGLVWALCNVLSNIRCWGACRVLGKIFLATHNRIITFGSILQTKGRCDMKKEIQIYYGFCLRWRCDMNVVHYTECDDPHRQVLAETSLFVGILICLHGSTLCTGDLGRVTASVLCDDFSAHGIKGCLQYNITFFNSDAWLILLYLWSSQTNKCILLEKVTQLLAFHLSSETPCSSWSVIHLLRLYQLPGIASKQSPPLGLQHK